jgi:hypothetical protein
VIEREQVFRTVERAEIEAEAVHLTNGAEFHHGMERRGDRRIHVVCFDSERAAKEMQCLLTNDMIAKRPAPKFEPSKERAAQAEAAVIWGLRIGPARRIVQAWCLTPGSLLRKETESQRAALHRMSVSRTPLPSTSCHGRWRTIRPGSIAIGMRSIVPMAGRTGDAWWYVPKGMMPSSMSLRLSVILVWTSIGVAGATVWQSDS